MNNQDSFYKILYSIILNAFKDFDMLNNVNDSLNILKEFLKADNFLLFKLNNEDEYIKLQSESLTINQLNLIVIILNKVQSTLNNKTYLQIDINQKQGIKNVLFFSIKNENNTYIIAYTNSKIELHENEEYFKEIYDTLKVIFEKYELYIKLDKKSKIDALTGLNNRNAFNEIEKIIDSNNDQYIITIFDLFGLKSVNDNYGHIVGDLYIIKTAEILQKYFPKYYFVKSNSGLIKKIETGFSIYRYGGDEFILITNQNLLEIVQTKTLEVTKEITEIDLEINKKLVLGLNYGIAKRNNNEPIKSIINRADVLLKNDKTAMYRKLGIDRRK